MAGSSDRARKRAREQFEAGRQARLARQRQNRKRFGVGLAGLCALGLVAGLIAVFAVGGSTAAAKKPAASASASASASAATSAAALAEPARHCTYTPTGTGSQPSLPSAVPDGKAAYTATISTNLGPVRIDLANSKATCTVNSFVHLAATHFWDNTQCHRLSDGGGLYILQCGDPGSKAALKLSCSSSTVGTGGPGYAFASENLTGATYPAGTVAMANSGGASTNGSQFFLVFARSKLPPDYTPFGTITSGLDILQNVAKAGTACTYPSAGGGVPREKVILDSVSIKKTTA